MIGIILFIAAIYLIGTKNNLFSSTFQIVAVFKDIKGLQGGNAVRFNGIDIGTIKEVKIANDSSGIVTMVIEEDIKNSGNKSK